MVEEGDVDQSMETGLLRANKKIFRKIRSNSYWCAIVFMFLVIEMIMRRIPGSSLATARASFFSKRAFSAVIFWWPKGAASHNVGDSDAATCNAAMR